LQTITVSDAGPVSELIIKFNSSEGVGLVRIETVSDGLWISIPEFHNGEPFLKIDMYGGSPYEREGKPEDAPAYPKELRVFADDDEPVFAMNLTDDQALQEITLREDFEIVRPAIPMRERAKIEFAWTKEE